MIHIERRDGWKVREVLDGSCWWFDNPVLRSLVPKVTLLRGNDPGRMFGTVDDRINMPALKRFVTDRHPDYQLPKPKAPERLEQIAVVGSGPAGLVCAYPLRPKGYQAGRSE